MSRVDEQLSDQFYQWEKRGRGWQVFAEPVVPEPPFRPFAGHGLPEPPAVDDGRCPTFLSSLVQNLSQKLSTQPSAAPEVPEPDEELEPQLLIRDALVELQTSQPASLNIPKEAFEQFLSNLSLCREPITFELLGMHEKVLAQFATHADDAPLVRRQLQAYFPEATFQPSVSPLAQIWDACAGDQMLAVEFGLEREFMLPLAGGKLDPFIGIIGALSELQLGELGLFQVLFQPVQHDWAESITWAVTHADGKPFFVNRPELAAAAKNKIARPLYAAIVRILVRTEDYDRTLQIARDLAGSLRVFIHQRVVVFGEIASALLCLSSFAQFFLALATHPNAFGKTHHSFLGLPAARTARLRSGFGRAGGSNRLTGWSTGLQAFACINS